MHTFYNGLSDSARTIIDASTGSALMKKTTDQAYEILEDKATNTNHWPRDRSAPRKPLAGENTNVINNLVTPPTRHRVSSEGSFFFFLNL